MSPSFFNFIGGISFIKPTFLPIYLNIGKNHTKGISYSLSSGQELDFKKKVFLIYDVPTFFELDLINNKKKLKQNKLKQYPGFLIDLGNYTDFTNYFSSTFSKSSRYKLTKYKKRLESCFDISYKMYYGAIDPDQYRTIFVYFKQLLEKRFLDKGTTNNNLDPKEWNFYTEVAYPMILEKKASLFVIYNGDTPIGVTLNYFSDTIVFDAITVFDIDYEKFHLGSVTIMKLIEWSINQKFKYFDFSKGYFDYKKRWATMEYYFEYHLYYDKSSIISIVLGNTIALYFNLKQYFRDKNLNAKIHKLTFWFRNLQVKKNERERYLSIPIEGEMNLEKFIEINRDSDEWQDLKSNIFEFLYLNNSSEKDLKVKKSTLDKNRFVLECKDKRVILTMSKSN
tara:strand:+ start:48933 stop:50117 length:1185 start_codon:yes stop_codon:yes gene_type:complete